MSSQREQLGADAEDELKPSSPRLIALVNQIEQRRARGELLTDEQIQAAYPGLWPHLRAALALRGNIRVQMLAAFKAGIKDQALPPISPDRTEQPVEVDETPPPPLDPTLKIGGYTLLRKISSGGQASVFLATQHTTGRTVAVKVMSGGPFITQQLRTRFEREAGILAQLNHRGIVSIVDRGRTSDGSYFLAMEYVEGHALNDYLALCRQRGVPQEQIVALFLRVAEALEEAHNRGVIHRDLKPTNVRVDGRGEPHVLDFGLARLTRPDQAHWRETQVTVMGHVIGSVPWASPEQVSGDVARMSAASDVYSFGVMLYQALTGRDPYPMDGTIKQMIEIICGTKPADPAQFTDCPFGRIDRRLADIILKTLEKDPTRRYATAGPLADDLDAYLAGQPTRADAMRRSRRAWLWALGAALALAAATGGWWALRWNNPPRRVVNVIALYSIPNGVGMEMVRIPPGTFRMGSSFAEEGRDSDERQRVVTIPEPFLIARTEVTRAQYRRVMGALPPDASPAADDNCPVDGVSWHDAVEFCRRLSAQEGRVYRLPTEAEWEYACRAGTTGPYGGTGRLQDMGWFAGNSGGRLHPVGKLQQNHWGLYDMHGNVAEWCGDEERNRADLESALPALEAPRVIRGGGAGSRFDECRSASRVATSPGNSRRFLGFRVVCTLMTGDAQVAVPEGGP